VLDDAELLEGMLRDSGGVEVVSGATRTWGHVDVADEVLLQEAGVKGAKLVLTIATGRLSAAQDTEVTVKTGLHADDYTVRDSMREDDGALTKLFLKRA
jgi:hypothetical protein